MLDLEKILEHVLIGMILALVVVGMTKLANVLTNIT